MEPAATSTSEKRVRLLLRAMLLVMAGQLLVLCFLCRLSTGHWNALSLMWRGNDFQFYYHAANLWLAGHNPYKYDGFVTPPPSLLLPALLARLDVAQAENLFSWVCAAIIPLSVWWYARVMGLQRVERILLVCISAVFTPSVELIHNGNMDGLIFACLVAAFTLRSRAAGSLGMAAAIALKIYPTALLAVWARCRQWRRMALVAAWLLLMMLPFLPLWKASGHTLLYRQSRVDVASVSPFAILSVLTGSKGIEVQLICLAFWLGTLLLALRNDHNRELVPAALARYAPWLTAWPPLVFSYVGVNLLPVPVALAATAARRHLTHLESLSLAGFLIVNLRLEQFTNLLPIADYKRFWHIGPAIQSCGVVLLMLGSCLSVTGRNTEDA